MKKNNLFVLIAVSVFTISLVISCTKSTEVNEIPVLKTDANNITNFKLDTITNLSQMKSDKVIWNDHGIFRTVTMEASLEKAEEVINTINNKSTSTCPTSFAGTDRATAKTTFPNATPISYPTFTAFHNALPTDAFMTGLNISRTSSRVTQENKNVTFTNGYLYAIKHESDNDLHMIIGDASGVSVTNCESSGYPSTTSASYTQIKNVRVAITTHFSTDFCGQSSYMIFSPPVHLTSFKGGLFFDVDHAAGTVGPAAYKPNTAWEIHPISAIQF